MEPLCREWERDDLDAVRNVTWQTWLDAYSPFIGVEDLRTYFDENYTPVGMDQLFRNPEVRGFVALVDARVVGSLRAFYNKTENRLYVSSLYILPGFQGTGLGGRLMQMAEEHARTIGVREIWLGVMNQNTRALDWYRRHGFVFVEERPFTMGNATVPHLIGFRRLAGAPAGHEKRPRATGI